MGFFDSMRALESAYIEARYGNGPRSLEDDDYDDWHVSATQTYATMPRSREAVLFALKRQNRVRFRQLQNDIKWAQKHLRKMGLDQDSWKDLL